uniref:CCHC-type domain-containing protein n=1 Tax=Quercus lobata TaxID=97700 RepID=A0A7N2N040_QUELO
MKPLITTVRVGKLWRKVLYEGISALCFCCGRLGHKQETCNFRVASSEQIRKDDSPTQSFGSQDATQTESRFGEWMLVKKQKCSVQNGKGHGTRILNQQDVNSKATKGLDSHLCNSLTTFRPDMTLKFNMGQASVAVGVSSSLEPRDKGCHMQLAHDTTPMEKSEVSLRTANDMLIFQSPQKVDSQKEKSTITSRERKNLITKGNRSLKRPNPDFVQSHKISLFEESSSTSYGDNHHNLSASGTNGVGNMHQHGKVVARSSSMGNNSKPMVELSHGCTSDIRGSCSGVELVKTSIGAASLGQIRMACLGKEGDRLQGLSDIPSGEFSNHEAISNSPTHGEMRSSSML